jgi:predicted lipoprotein with Yx(FWY)xxD motif
MNRTRFAFIVGTALLGMSALTACASDEGPTAKDDPSTSESAPDESSAEVKLATADVGNLGNVVVDGNGRTLYMFDQDTADPPKSNCDGECATKWPPVIAGSGTPELDGIDASLVGTVTRSDGSEQVTLSGWPLYLFASDTKAGDAKGQAVGGVWWVLGPDGKKISTQPSAASGGY